MREVFVAGIGAATLGRSAASSIESLVVQAAAKAVLDLAIERRDIGALSLGDFINSPTFRAEKNA